jgi:7-cyano-7-deazaguanine synthase in queuosine biosynthesis
MLRLKKCVKNIGSGIGKMRQYNIICGGLKIPKRLAQEETISLDVQGDEKNVILKIDAINKATLSNIPNELLDLLEIGAYVYAADQHIGRGSETLANYGQSWRRDLNFIIPVRNPDLWNSPDLRRALEETLGFLAGETYRLSFECAAAPMAEKQRYFEFSEGGIEPDEVALFSGGVDSFAGAVEGIVGHGRKMVLIGHHSANKIKGVQTELVNELCNRGHKANIQYISVEVRNSGSEVREYTQRTRSFLFACLAVGIAHMLGKDRFSFYENGVVSLNLPLTKDTIESRATRTTHPRVINGFQDIFSLVLKRQITIDHPFQWVTKKEVTQKISQYGMESLIGLTNSCTRPRAWTTKQKHCGACSQCIDRRFAILAAGLEAHEDSASYRIDLLTGDRSLDKEIVMAASYVKFAQQFSQLSKDRFISEHPQISSALGEFSDLSTEQAEENIFHLYQRHSEDVLDVLNNGLSLYRDRLLTGTLPSGCLIATAFNRGTIECAIPSGYDAALLETLDKLTPKRCQFYVDAEQKQVLFKGRYAVIGEGYNLISALLDNFQNGKKNGHDVSFITSIKLASKLHTDEPNLRARITRLRNELTERLAVDQGIALGTDDFIENSQRKGYRLHPQLKEVMALADLDD